MRILIVEDEQKIANALQKTLQREAYAVDVAYDGDEGCVMATTEPYDLMIIDRMLPGDFDGLGIVREIRSKKINTPVLFLSALGRSEDKVEGLNIGADDYLAKPFSLDELLARVKALLRRPSNAQDEILKVADLTLNTSTREAQRADKNIELTNKEFALLELLMKNKGRPVSKEHIIDSLWNFEADVLPNNVEVYIKYLRNKIDKPFKKALIHTVRGFGYKMEVL